MDKLIADGAALSPALLATDEENYDKLATSLAGKLQAVPSTHLASKDVLEVCRLKDPPNTSRLTTL